MDDEVSRMSLKTRWLNWSSTSPAAVIWTRRPRRTKSRSWNSSSRSRICRLIADGGKFGRGPAPANDPVWARARTIPGGLRPRVVRAVRARPYRNAGFGLKTRLNFEAMPARREIIKTYSSHRICSCLEAAITAQGPDPVGEFSQIRKGPLAPRVGAGDLDVAVEGVFPRPPAQGTRFELRQVYL